MWRAGWESALGSSFRSQPKRFLALPRFRAAIPSKRVLIFFLVIAHFDILDSFPRAKSRQTGGHPHVYERSAGH